MRPSRLQVGSLIGLAAIFAASVAWAAMIALSRSVESDPDRLSQSIQEALRGGHIDAADALVDRLLKCRPATDQEWLALGQIAVAKGDVVHGLEHLARVSDLHPAAAKIRSWQGSLELKNRRAHRAEIALLAAVRLDPHDPEPRRKLIVIYCMQRRRRELSDQFAALARLVVLNFDDMSLWGSSMAESWDPSEVQPILSGFIDADPDDRCSRLALAEALRRLRREDEVEPVLSRFPSSDPDARAIRARIALHRGDIAELERLTVDPPAAHPGLARMRARLALSRRDFADACKQLRIALAADPHNRFVLLQLGDSMIKSENVDEGRRYQALAQKHDALFALFEKAAEPAGRRDIRLLAQIAAASLDLGLHAQARAWNLLALELDATNPDIQQAIYRLDHGPNGSVAGAASHQSPDS